MVFVCRIPWRRRAIITWNGLVVAWSNNNMELAPYTRACITATCSSVTISDFGEFSGTYEEGTLVVWDESYSMSSGAYTYSLYVYDNAWNLQIDGNNYPRYRVSSGSAILCASPICPLGIGAWSAWLGCALSFTRAFPRPRTCFCIKGRRTV